MATHKKITKLVYTLKDKCRVCYTCVRECPVKAIKIINGQAEAINERCIGCGNCIKVCSQGAKVYLNSIDAVYELIQNHPKVVACVAPSFPAEFMEIEDYRILVGMIKELGFTSVHEVSFGADMVANEYKKLLTDPDSIPTISSDCPAIVYYIEHYHPELVEYLAPIASPMVVSVRILKQLLGDDIKTVFIGPCIAKKAESIEVDEVITFAELRQLFKIRGIMPEATTPCDFDPPHSGKAAIFPVSRGLLHSVNESEDISEGNVIVADGRQSFREAIHEFENGLIKQHLELLCCEGCIMGPGMSKYSSRYARQIKIRDYVRNKLKHLNVKTWEQTIKELSDIDLTQKFMPNDRRIELPNEDEILKVLNNMGKYTSKDHLNCGACGYDTCYEHAVAIAQGIAENEMCLPFTIEKLHDYISDLNISNQKLADTKQALKQSEKLASMGQLSAGIAHELNNPLGVITMYSNILLEETPLDNPIHADLELIAQQTERCKKIVGGLLNFARKSQVNKSEINIIEFIKNSLNSVVIPGNVNVELIPSLEEEIIHIDKDQMMQVITNLEKNAIEAMPEGGKLTIELSDDSTQTLIAVKDTGTGIPKENMDKIFTPFFTTKEVGKGTGLGLPLVYGIVKMHNGKLEVESNTDKSTAPTGTVFKIYLPKRIMGC